MMENFQEIILRMFNEKK